MKPILKQINLCAISMTPSFQDEEKHNFDRVLLNHLSVTESGVLPNYSNRVMQSENESNCDKSIDF